MTDFVSQVTAHIRRETQKVIVGQDAVIDQVLICLFADGHALLEGVPGTAKTLMVRTIATIIGAGFNRIQFTPDMMPSDITGTNVFNLNTSQFTLRPGPIFTDILLADEINRTPPKTQAALLGAVEDRSRSMVNATGSLLFFWCWRLKTLSSMKAPTRCPKPSSIGSSSRF